MQPGKPIVGSDIVVFLDRNTGKAMVEFRIEKFDITGLAFVYIIRNNLTRKLIEKINLSTIPENQNIFTYSFEFNREEYYDKYRETYPLFKFRIEAVDNSRIYTESNEFKITIS